jgi:hypothetical protein
MAPHTHHVRKLDPRDYPPMLITLPKFTVFTVYTECLAFAIVYGCQQYTIMRMSAVALQARNNAVPLY